MMTEQEFAYLSDRIRGRLTALARRFNRASGCDADAEDIVQDALLTLRNEQGLSLDEIAEATGRPKSSIKVALSTARKRMLEQMKKLK